MTKALGEVRGRVESNPALCHQPLVLARSGKKRLGWGLDVAMSPAKSLLGCCPPR